MVLTPDTLHERRVKINRPDSIASKTTGWPASATLLLPKERGFFRVRFCAAGKLNNTKSVGFALDTYLSSEIYRFLKRAVPIKGVDFAIVAQDNDLVNHKIPPILRALQSQ
jgi:hypothetical protein